MTNLGKRVLVGLVGIPLAVSLVYAGSWYFILAIVAIAIQALREFYHLADSKHASPNQTVGIGVTAAMLLGVGYMVEGDGARGLMASASVIGLVMMVGTILTLTIELFRAKENAVFNTSTTMFGVTYIGISMASLIGLRFTKQPELLGAWGGEGCSLVVTLFASVWMADIAAYFVGLTIGRHKLFPRVSPKKSWEGAIGGFVGSTAAFAALAAYLLPSLALPTALACGAVVGIVGPLGDLAESLLKRDATVKDSGELLPGHGGVFDRFDSMLFAAPVVFLILHADHIAHLFTR
jgi:phosphatidate cytidylyltransferase